MDINRSLGEYVGAYIYFKYLPTLNTDMILSRNVINVSDEDFKRHELVEKALNKTYEFNGGDGNNENEFKVFCDLNKELAKKYLPHILKCYVPKVEPTDIESFKKGLREYLWDTDLCWYKIGKNEDIEIGSEYGNTIINLKLKL